MTQAGACCRLLHYYYCLEALWYLTGTQNWLNNGNKYMFKLKRLPWQLEFKPRLEAAFFLTLKSKFNFRAMAKEAESNRPSPNRAAHFSLQVLTSLDSGGFQNGEEHAKRKGVPLKSGIRGHHQSVVLSWTPETKWGSPGGPDLRFPAPVLICKL